MSEASRGELASLSGNDWALAWGADETDTPLSVAARQIIARFALGAALPEEHDELLALSALLRAQAPADAIDAAMRRLISAGFLRGSVALVAESLLEQPRGDVAIRLASELLDAVDVELGVALTRAVLALPLSQRDALDPAGLYAQANQLLAEAYEHAGDAAAALRHWEAVFAMDVDHPRALAGFARASRALAGREQDPHRAQQGLAIIDGLDALDVDAVLGGDRYLLGRPLGRGRHASVHEATDRHVGRDVAIKRLLKLSPGQDAALHRKIEARFLAEAQTLARVRHPHVVALLDVRPAERFIAMELCRGGNLRMAVRRQQLNWHVIERMSEQLGSALRFVHRQGAVHRDIKPANILLRDTGPQSDFVLADFGVAVEGSTLSRTGASRDDGRAGTLRYLAPEVRLGATATPSSDLFALGVVLLELCLWPTPLPRDLDALELRMEVARAIPAHVPAGIAERLESLLSHDPAHRTL